MRQTLLINQNSQQPHNVKLSFTIFREYIENVFISYISYKYLFHLKLKKNIVTWIKISVNIAELLRIHNFLFYTLQVQILLTSEDDYHL